MDEPVVASRARQLLGLALIGVIVLAGMYLLSVRTALGQTWGDEAYLDRVAEGRGLTWIDKHVLKAIDIRILAVLLLIVVAVGSVRRQWFATVAVCAAYIGAMVSAEGLKLALPRPILAPELEALMGDKDALNTYPSGHATLATCLVLGLLILVPARVRPPVAVVGAAFVAFVASGVVAAGWHRPSDAVGGIALALLWLTAAGALILRRLGIPSPVAPAMRLVPAVGAVIVVSAAAIVALSLLRGDDSKVPGGVSDMAFPLAELAIDVWAVVTVILVARVLRDVELAPRRAPEFGGPLAGLPR